MWRKYFNKAPNLQRKSYEKNFNDKINFWKQTHPLPHTALKYAAYQTRYLDKK